jgi:hypothetical protein
MLSVKKLLIVTIISTIGFVHSNVTKTCKSSTKYRILRLKPIFIIFITIIVYIIIFKNQINFLVILKRGRIYAISFLFKYI